MTKTKPLKCTFEINMYISGQGGGGFYIITKATLWEMQQLLISQPLCLHAYN
jgi:hypothetical protein